MSEPPENSNHVTEKRPTRILLAVNKQEYRSFFPDFRPQDRLPSDVHFQEFDTGKETKFHEKLESLRPDVIIGSWSTPPLPVPDDGVPIDYYCHLAGSIKKQIPRLLLERGLKVTNWGNSVAKAVAESAVTLALASLKNLTHHQFEMHVRRSWRRKDFRSQKSLHLARVGIHGLGAIGREIAGLLKTFGSEIKAWDPYVNAAVFHHLEVSRAESLDELFSSSDVFFECSALTHETRGIVSAKMLSLLPHDATFVNIARGQLVDEEALCAAIKSGRIRAGLDVFSSEPLPADSSLRGLEGLVLTPHLAGNTETARANAGEHALKNLARYLSERKLESLISLSQYDLMT